MSSTGGSNIPKPSKIAKPIAGSSLTRSVESPSGLVSKTSKHRLKIGDKVLVRDTSPGVIAFLGETQFAPDIWAGVTLDEPVGKNDGSVSGISYFKCKPMHGIFSKPSRLSLMKESGSPAPIPNIMLPSLQPSDGFSKANTRIPNLNIKTPMATRHPDLNEVKERSPSPTDSVASALSGRVSEPPKIGDRVIVSSATGGSKVGTLRYIGSTDFAAGVWAGVELDLPMGKNDGSVQDVRYFESKANHGVFVLSSKIAKSPRNAAPSRQLSNLSTISTVTPARNMSRQKSDVSNVSITSSAGKKRSVSSINAPEMLKLSLKEKESLIEKLTSERDMERAEVAKAAGQTDVIEEKLRTIEKDFASYKLESLKKEKYLDSELQTTTFQLSELQQKYEDLQFNFEEMSLAKGQSETQNDVKISDISMDIEEKKTIISELEEKLANISKFKSEAEIKIRDLEEKCSDMTFESEEKIVALNIEIEELKRQNDKTKASFEKEKEKSTLAQDKFKAEESTINKKIESFERDISEKDDYILELKLKVESHENSEKSSNEKFNKSAADIKEMSLKNQELLTKCSRMEGEISTQSTEVDRLKSKIGLLTEEKDAKDIELKETSKELASIQKSLKVKTSENESLSAKLSENSSSVADELKSYIEENAQLKEQIDSTGDKLNQANKKISNIEEQLQEKENELSHSKKITDDAFTLKNDLEKEIEALRSGSSINNEEVKRLSGCLSLKDSEMTTLRADLSNLVAQLNTLKDVITQNENEAKEKEARLIRDHEKAIGKLEESVKAKEHSIKKLEKFKADILDSSYEKLKTAREKHAEEVEILKKQLTESLTENAQLKESLENAYMQIKEVGSENSDELLSLREAIESNMENTRFKEAELKTVETKLSEASLSIQRVENERLKEKQNKMDLQERLESLQRTHDEEMGELVDVVNDLKEKEDELKVAVGELERKADALVKLEMESNRKEQAYKEEIARLKSSSSSELGATLKALENSKGQISYLNESLASAKLNYDLRKEKMDREKSSLEENYEREIEKREDTIRKLGDDLLSKEIEYEVINDELKSKLEELEQVSLDLEVKEVSFNNSVQINEDSHKQEVEVLVSKIEDAEFQIGNLNERLAKTKADHDSKVDELILERKTEVNNLQDLISERDRHIVDLKAQCVEFENKIKDLTRTMEDEIKILRAKVDKFSSETEELRIAKRDLESNVKILIQQQDDVGIQHEELSIKLIEKERQVKEYTSQAQSIKLTYEKTKKELNEHLEKSVEKSSILEEVKSSLDGERRRVDELQVCLGEAETERDTLRAQLLDFGAIKEKLASYEENEKVINKKIEDLKQKEAFTERAFEEERKELNDVVQKSQILLREKLEEFKDQKREFESLQAENVQLNSYKRSVLILEQEKRELENKLAVFTIASGNNNSLIRTDSPKLNGKADNDENLENLRSQVDFLNSVIVDMQRKNDEYKMKLELYQSGKVVAGEDADDETSQLNLLLNGINPRQVPPRLFCDICDQFDIHDTEDCPTQAMTVIEEESHSRNAASRISNRPYCESCEVFGHETENCNEAETF